MNLWLNVYIQVCGRKFWWAKIVFSNSSFIFFNVGFECLMMIEREEHMITFGASVIKNLQVHIFMLPKTIPLYYVTPRSCVHFYGSAPKRQTRQKILFLLWLTSFASPPQKWIPQFFLISLSQMYAYNISSFCSQFSNTKNCIHFFSTWTHLATLKKPARRFK